MTDKCTPSVLKSMPFSTKGHFLQDKKYTLGDILISYGISWRYSEIFQHSILIRTWNGVCSVWEVHRFHDLKHWNISGRKIDSTFVWLKKCNVCQKDAHGDTLNFILNMVDQNFFFCIILCFIKIFLIFHNKYHVLKLNHKRI